MVEPLRRSPWRSLARSALQVYPERLGHCSVAFTLDTYAHVMSEAAEMFNELVYGDLDDSTDTNEDPDDRHL